MDLLERGYYSKLLELANKIVKSNGDLEGIRYLNDELLEIVCERYGNDEEEKVDKKEEHTTEVDDYMLPEENIKDLEESEEEEYEVPPKKRKK